MENTGLTLSQNKNFAPPSPQPYIPCRGSTPETGLATYLLYGLWWIDTKD